MANINYMDRPHRYTAGPAGRCLFCSHSQAFHATNRPKTPAERAQEEAQQKLQDQAQDKADHAFMLTPVPTEADLVAEAGKEMKVQDQAAKIAGNALYDENDPMATAGLGGKKSPADPGADDLGGGAGDGAGGELAMSAPMTKSQGFSGSGDNDSGDTPLPGSVAADYSNATIDEIKARKKAQQGPAKPAAKSPVTPPAKPSEPSPDDPNARHATNLPNEGEDPGGDPGYKPPLSDEPRNGISDAQRQVHADSGEALPDGTMPIRNGATAEPDLAAAQKVWGKHPDPHAARDHIVRRAGELDLTHQLHPALASHAKSQQESYTNKARSGARQAGARLGVARPGSARQGEGSGGESQAFRYSITKAADEQRFSFGPLYMPSSLDAHSEYTDARTLQKALWSYMDRTDRRINLQHQRGVTAGRLVEAVSWPEPHTATLTVPNTATLTIPNPTVVKSAVTFPAGTAYVGVIWEPWAWNLVKAGKLRGLSMGGSANRVAADLDVPASTTVTKRHVAAVLKARGHLVPAAPPKSPPPTFGYQRVPVEKFRVDQPRVPRGRKGGGRWLGGIGPGAGYVVSHALDAPHAETPVPGRRNVTRVTSRAVTLNQPDPEMTDRRKAAHLGDIITDVIMGTIVRGTGGVARMGGASSRAGVYVGKSKDPVPVGIYLAPEDVPEEPPPFPGDLVEKRKVASEAGVRRYHLPIGSPIVAHPYQRKGRKKKGAGTGLDSFESSSAGSGEAGNTTVPSADTPSDGPDVSGPEYDTARQLAGSILADAAKVEPKLTSILTSAAEANNGRMDGLKNRLKTEKSLTRKIHDKAILKNVSEEDYAGQIGDSVRYTVVFPDSDTAFADGVEATKADLAKQFEIFDEENSFVPDNTYKGLHMSLRDAETGLVAELQFHTESSIAAKGPSHEIFNKTRDPNTPPEERERLNEELAALWAAVPDPPRAQMFGKKVIRKDRLRKRPAQSPVRGVYVLH